MSGRILIAKPGLDGHDRGALLVGRVLRDAGFEVIYVGLRQTPEMIVAAALDEDVQIIGLSVLTGGHLGLARKVLRRLDEAEAGDIQVIVGGVIPSDDIPLLLEMGVAAVFPSSTPLADIVGGVRALLTVPA